MKRSSVYIIFVLIFASMLSACHQDKLILSFTLNTEDPNPFGWPVRLDTFLIHGDQHLELTAGKTTCGAWIAYRCLPDQDSVYEIWVDQDNDGTLIDEQPFNMKHGERKTGIMVHLPQQPSYESLPYCIDVKGNPNSPYIYWKPNYRMESQLVYDEDSSDIITLWDTNGNGIFERSDARGGVSLTGPGFSNINSIIRIDEECYLLDTLMPDGALVELCKTDLKPVAVDEEFPKSDLYTINGTKYNSQNSQGKWTMYNFCNECIRSNCINLKEETKDYFKENSDTVRLVTIIVSTQVDSPTLVNDVNMLDLPGDVILLDEGSDLWKRVGSIKDCNMRPPFRLLCDPYEKVKAIGPTINLLFKGQRFPDFVQSDTTGNQVCGSDFIGYPILIDFWASWCEPCLKEIPYMKTYASELYSKGLQIIMISLDSERKRWFDAINQYELPGIHLSDLQGWNNQVGKKYGITTIPFNVLINERGLIVDMNLRGGKLKQALEKLVEESI